jgi:uncharacterized membrane protein (UPF0127 family)
MITPPCHSELIRRCAPQDWLREGIGVYPERATRAGRSDFCHLSPREKIHRFAELLRSANSALAGRNQVLCCIRNQTRGTVLCARATLARGFRDRSRGLLGRRQLSPDEGMLFEAKPVPLVWMHTFFMTFPIDIVFLGRGDVVIKIQSSLKPWRLSAIVIGARKAIELPAGTAARAETAVGDLISLAEVQDSGDPTRCVP